MFENVDTYIATDDIGLLTNEPKDSGELKKTMLVLT